ncbi:AP-3 complex subunit beta [Coemansia sp. RSA 1813]|nr:AP-3 complex subunit beta [Coemansia sp. RSA 1646]KAJ1773465.1 AP-3 complex subunit beta [Coemansia sp. RSA 1843]KAJ2091279.1 AP-3 complex subunit beta [Coemansia sp. RSA 986]KAJ2216469.1 AP-3 complex subunit beta [Coemansia sp. RSA 487]KAJ2571447.1 AP-3 complex subunit beta [Coemansia sp. RSA 1813]
MAEYLSRAMALAQDAAKLSLRFSEEIVDNALEFGLDTPGSFYNNAEYNLGTVRKALNSGADKEKVVAMKRLLVIIARGVDASEYFADVVKNVASGSLEVRRLVYIYLLRYAEQEQDLALLSVNTFQRDLADANQVIRAMALRVMTSIRVPVISSIAMMAVRKLAKDRSPHVRKTAALAIPKLLRLDASLKGELIEVVAEMLSESSPLAVGSVIQAFTTVCPTDYDMVHLNYRRWCLMVSELDEWGQVELVKLLTAYARTHFLRPFVADDKGSKSGKEALNDLDPDHALLIKSIHPLLQSRNSAVVMGAVSAYYHLAPADQLGSVARPLVRLMKTNREAGYVALANILQIALRRPEIFNPHVRSFYVAALDPPFIRKLKLQVLAAIASSDTVHFLVPEVASYTQSTQEDVSVGAIGVLLACAQRIRESTMDCFQSLIILIDDPRDDVVSEAARAIRILLLDGSVRDSQDRRAVTLYDILCYLARRLDKCTADMARAYIFSLVSEFATSKFGYLHGLDVLRSAVRLFKEEGVQTKMQILELSARFVLLSKEKSTKGGATNEAGSGNIAPQSAVNSRGEDMAERLRQHTGILNDLHTYLFTLARYDVSFEVRERARMLRALCPLGGDEAHTEKMASVLELSGELIGYGSKQILDSQTSEELKKSLAAQPKYTIGSLSLTMDRVIKEYLPLPDWPTSMPEDVNRGIVSASSANAVGGGSAVASIPDIQAPGGSRAISIAGISGRAQPHTAYADFSTPRSVDGRGNADDDLDAFLNSEDDRRAPPTRAGPEFMHAPLQSVQRQAVIFKQSELSSESSFSDSSDSELGDSNPDDSASEHSASSGSESDSELDDGASPEESSSSSRSDRESGDEQNPFIDSKRAHSHTSVAVLDDPFADSQSTSQPPAQHNKNTDYVGLGARHNSDDESHTQPLIEGTSKYWQ